MSLSFLVFNSKLELNGIISHCLTTFYQNIAAMKSERYCKQRFQISEWHAFISPQRMHKMSRAEPPRL